MALCEVEIVLLKDFPTGFVSDTAIEKSDFGSTQSVLCDLDFGSGNVMEKTAFLAKLQIEERILKSKECTFSVSFLTNQCINQLKDIQS